MTEVLLQTFSGNGQGIGISGDGLVLAFRFNDTTLRLYHRVNGVWTQMGSDIKAQANYKIRSDRIALNQDGTIILFGEFYNYSTQLYGGAAHRYEFNGTNWVNKWSSIKPTNILANYGSDVSLTSDGKVFAVGSTHSPNDTQEKGTIEVFDWDANINTATMRTILEGENYSQTNSQDTNTVSFDRMSKHSLSSDGNTIVVGAPFHNDDNTTNSVNGGRVRVFAHDFVNGVSTWTQKGQNIDSEGPYNFFGHSVQISALGDVEVWTYLVYWLFDINILLVHSLRKYFILSILGS